MTVLCRFNALGRERRARYAGFRDVSAKFLLDGFIFRALECDNESTDTQQSIQFGGRVTSILIRISKSNNGGYFTSILMRISQSMSKECFVRFVPVCLFQLAPLWVGLHDNVHNPLLDFLLREGSICHALFVVDAVNDRLGSALLFVQVFHPAIAFFDSHAGFPLSIPSLSFLRGTVTYSVRRNITSRPIHVGIYGSIRVTIERPHRFRPTQCDVEHSRIVLLGFPIARIYDQILEHVRVVRPGFKTLKFMYGGCPTRNERAVLHFATARFAIAIFFPHWDRNMLTEEGKEQTNACGQ